MGPGWACKVRKNRAGRESRHNAPLTA